MNDTDRASMSTRRRTRVWIALALALLAWPVVAPAAPAPLRRVDAVHGRDAWPGTAAQPWRTLERANRAAPGTVVRVAPGDYGDAPVAAGVTFVGESQGSHRAVVTSAIVLDGTGTRLRGLTLAGGLTFEGAARNNVVDGCTILRHFRIEGGVDAAPRFNRVVRTRMRIDDLTAKARDGDRLLDAPRIVAPAIVGCDITVTRDGGVLWRWSGVDDALIEGTTIRLVNGGHHNDDDASWKWFWVRRATIRDCRIVLDTRGDFGETGPFAPMWRDSTTGVRVVRTTIEATRGGFIFSPNTAGTWVCSCSDNRFDHVTVRAPGRLWLYQCPRPDNDVWVASSVEAGRFEAYNTGDMPRGLAVRAFAAARGAGRRRAR